MTRIPDATTVGYPPCSPTVTPPPFGDMTTRELIGALIAACQGHPSTRRLDLGRWGATPDDARRELRRRSAVGHA
jgi:hypothetical protein